MEMYFVVLNGAIIVRDKTRIDRILKQLGVLWKQCPDQRLGQFLENYVFTDGARGDNTSLALWYQEDDITEQKLKLLEEVVKND